jgi:phosphoesterase RecJ-like protein
MNKPLLRLNEDVKRALSVIIAEMSDRRVSGFAVITKCELSPDMGQCRVYLSYIEGKKLLDEKVAARKEADALECLRGAAGHIKHELAARVQLRKVPDIKFISDQSADILNNIDRLIAQEKARMEQIQQANKTITFDETIAALKAADNILVISHASPDGDTLGSAAALLNGLVGFGKNVKFFVNEAQSAYFDYLGLEVVGEDFQPDFIVSVDVAVPKLFGEPKTETVKYWFENIDLCIDHHYNTNSRYAKQTYLEDTAAAAEIVYKLLIGAGAEITPIIAAAVYTGIATDTGCFKYSNVTASTHRITADLFETGFDAARINYILFERKTKRKLELERYVAENIGYLFNGRVAYSILPNAEYIKYDPEELNTGASIPRQIEGVDIGVFIKEKSPDKWFFSFRTSENVGAEDVAKQFGGGGHKRASGGRYEGKGDILPQLLAEKLAKFF